MRDAGLQGNAATRRSCVITTFGLLILGALGAPDAAAQVASTTVLTPASASVPAGKSVTLSATVTAAAKPVTPGLVNFCSATVAYCGGTALLGSGQLGTGGTARINLVLGIGTHQVKAVFTGTREAAASSSAALTVTVTGSNTSASFVGPTVGDSMTVHNLVTTITAHSSRAPTGTVSLLEVMNNNAVLATAPVVNGAVQSSYAASQMATTAVLPTALVTADLNGDGLPDIAAANLNATGGTYLLSVYLSKGDGTFTTVSPSRETGAAPAALVAGDFNNDGVTDLAVANSISNNVSILLGNGDGSFRAAPVAPATGLGPMAITTGDFNRDGNADLAVANQGANTMTILLGDGHGGFTAAPGDPPATGTSPASVVSGDFNGDGNPDLAVANYFANSVTILAGNGDGTFTVGAALTTGVYPDWVAVGDFNGDGKPDLVVTNQFSATLTVLLGDGKGGFAPPATPGYAAPATGGQPSSVAVGDLDGDGRADLVITNQKDNSVQLYMGKGDGTFTASPARTTGAGTAPRSAALGDFDGDGNPDIAVADSGTNQVTVQHSVFTATATASVLNFAVTGFPEIVASYSGDMFNSPALSNPQFLVGTAIGSTTALAVQTPAFVGQPVLLTATVTGAAAGSGPVGGPMTFYAGTNPLDTVPVVNGIAKATATFSTVGTQVLSAEYLGSGVNLPSASSVVNLAVTAPAASAITLTASSASVARGTAVTLTATVTGGGKPVTRGTVSFCSAGAAFCEDAALLGRAQLTAAGKAILRLRLPVGTNSINAIFAGTPGVARAATNPQTVTVTGTYPTTTTLAATGTPGNYTLRATLSTVGPREPFGNVSFLDASNNNLQLASGQFFSLPNFAFAPPAALQTSPSPGPTVAADFNGDGIQDLVNVDTKSAQLTTWLGRGDGTFTAKASMPYGPSFGGLVAADFNNDGKMDLAFAESTTQKLIILAGNGDGTFTPLQTVTTGRFPAGLVTGDFNRDGNPDLAVLLNAANSVMVLLGNGDGTFTATAQPIAVDAFPTSLAVGDFNGDNYQDLVVTSSDQSTVTILLSDGRGGFTPGLAYPTGARPLSLTLGDFNKDGGTDIAWLNSADRTIGVLLASGGGKFQAVRPIPVPGNPWILVAGDFDGDGVIDLAASDLAASTMSFLHNDGTARFSPPFTVAVAGVVSSLATADFDGDGGLDFAYAESSNAAIGVMLRRPTSGTLATSIAIPGAGMHNIVASTVTSAPFAASSSSPVPLGASPVPTTTFIVVLPSPIVAPGSTVQAKVSVAPASADNYTLSGTVSLTVGTTRLTPATLVNGQATFAVPIPAIGTYQLTAVYSGSTLFAASASNPTPVYAAPASATSLIISSPSVGAGTPEFLVAAVTSGGAKVTKGSVLFCDGNAPVCADAALLGTAVLRPDGMASIAMTFGPGAHAIKAVFSGTTAVQASTSGSQSITVTGLRATTTTLASTLAGGTYTLTAGVAANGTQAPAGSVSFRNVTANTTMSTLALAAGTPKLSFSGATVATGAFPIAMAVADFNVDGQPDVIGLSQTTNTAFVLLGGAGGKLTAKTTVLVGTNPIAVAVGDFNGDSLPDAAVVGVQSNSVTILLGNGDGTFRAPSTIAVNAPLGIAVGDFNADGRQDLAVTNGFNNVTILLGNGDGTFQPSAAPVVAGVQPGAIVAADLTGDGRPDLLVLCSNGGANLANVLVGEADGTFTISASLPLGIGQGLATGDVNGDGKPDIVIGLPRDNAVLVFPGNGNGTFGAPAKFATGTVSPASVAVADLNGDGKPDIAVGGFASGPLVLTGDGKGAFTAQTPLGNTTGIQQALAIADFNGDGQPDLAVANYNGASIGVYLNALSTTSTATLSGVTVPGTAPRTVDAVYPGRAVFGASTSANVSLAPAP